MQDQKSICNRLFSDQCSSALERQEKSLWFGNYPSVEWCLSLLDSWLSGDSMLPEHHLKRHNDPEDEYCLPMHQAFVLSQNIKDHQALIYFDFSSAHFALNALCCIETGWGNQMNGNATFGFCSAIVDMICLWFNSMGSVNNLVCWSLFHIR